MDALGGIIVMFGYGLLALLIVIAVASTFAKDKS